jgi:DNA-binding MarR family transcriptional regulator
MSLEQDIQQQEFKNEYQKALINLLYTHNHVVARMSKVFKEFGITRQQYNVLRILRGQHPNKVTINVIKERMLDKMSDASRIVSRLNKKGLIERKQSKGDRRAADVSITNKGLGMLEKLDPITESFDSFFKNLEVADAQKLNNLLDSLRDNDSLNSIKNQ